MSDSAKWYVAHTYSGYENAVKTTIEKFVAHRNLQDMILDLELINLLLKIHYFLTEFTHDN